MITSELREIVINQSRRITHKIWPRPVEVGESEWTPALITTLGWWDASDESTITHSSGTVTTIADKSGNSLTLSANDAPQTGANTINSLNVIDINASDYFSYSGFTIPTSGDISFYLVAKITTIDNSADSLLSYDSSTADFQFEANHATQFNGQVGITGTGNTAYTLSGGPFTGPSLFRLCFNYGSGLEASVDGADVGSSSGYDTKLSNDGAQDLKVFSNRAGTNYPVGQFCELIITEDCNSDTKINIENYISEKWGITIQ